MEQVIPNYQSPLGEDAAVAWHSPEFVASLFKQGEVWRLSIARADYSDEPAGDWVDELVSYCATHPDDDLDDISPYGY